MIYCVSISCANICEFDDHLVSSLIDFDPEMMQGLIRIILSLANSGRSHHLSEYCRELLLNIVTSKC